MNHSQRNLKKLIRAKEDSIADEELFLSAAYQKYQTSLARAVTGRYRYGLQVLLDWDISEQAGVAYTDNYKVHLNAANPITQSFPTRFLRSQSLTGLTGHEVGHLLYSDFTAHAVHLRSLENGSFYPKEPELSLPAYQTALEEIKEVLEEKDKAGCLTLARCAATFQNILEDIHIEDRMCEEFHGTFRQGIELNNLRMSEQIPSIQEQIDKEYQPFSIIANLILSYCRTGNINNPTGYQGDYLDTISDCTDLLDTAMESEKGTDRMLVSNALLALTWNYIQPLIEKTREELEMHGEDSAADALEDLLGDEVSSGAPLPTGKSGAIPKNIKPASPKGSGNDEGNAPSGPRTKEDAIEEAKQVLSEEGGRIALTKTNTILDENNPGVTYVSQYQGSGYEHAAEDLFRILNDVAAEKVQEDCQTELTEELQKTANDIHYGNAHAGIHVTIHRLTSVSDYLKNEYQTVAPPLLRASKKLQSTILPLLKEEQQGGKQKNLLFGKRLDSHALYKTDGTIFTRTRLPGEEKRLAVALLIDESGSMGWGDRMTHARKTAIVLYDFCKSLGIPITIYGHSTDAGGVALYSYAEFDSVDNEDCYRLMDMCDRNGNRDGAALRFVAEHLCTRPELQKLLGKLHYRTSYGQNVLQHSIEVSHIAGMMAAELGADVQAAKRAGLLHDIGKALDHEFEGTHVALGVEYARKYREKEDIIHAIQAHHGDVECRTLVACLVQAADAISAARPGARRENLENYIKRLEKLEEITGSYPGVEKSYAIQAGREVRVMVKPEQVSEDEMVILARELAKRIESELEYPGQIKVHVLRETKVVEYAK